MAKYTVTKDFDYSEDGFTSKPVKAGEEIDVRDGLSVGLIAEGFIANGAAAETASKVAGASIKNADLGDVVSDTAKVKGKIATAEAGISDGHIGEPEASAIVKEDKPIPILPPVGENVVENDKPDQAKS